MEVRLSHEPALQFAISTENGNAANAEGLHAWRLLLEALDTSPARPIQVFRLIWMPSPSRSRGRDDIPAPSKIISSMSGCADAMKSASQNELVAARARQGRSRRLKRVSSAMSAGALFGDEDDLSDRVSLLNLAQRVGRLIQRNMSWRRAASPFPSRPVRRSRRVLRRRPRPCSASRARRALWLYPETGRSTSRRARRLV